MPPQPAPYSAGELLARHSAVSAVYRTLLDALASGDTAGALTAIPPDFRTQAQDFVAALAGSAQAVEAQIGEANRLNDATHDRSDRIVLAVTGVWAFVILGAGFVLYRFVLVPSHREREALLQKAIESGARDAEDLRRACLVVTRSGPHLPEVLQLDLLEENKTDARRLPSPAQAPVSAASLSSARGAVQARLESNTAIGKNRWRFIFLFDGSMARASMLRR